MRTIREWTLESELGRGGMGVVYRARHRFQDGLFAVKAIRPELVADAKVRAYFVREATQAGKLEHEGIVKTHLPFEEGGELFLPMEHLAGETLQSILEREGPQPEARALRLVRQAAEALAYAHARTPPVIHRDVKPANLFVLPGDRVKLIDFGLARALDGDSQLSSAGRLPGTPVYLSPEVLEGEEASPAADVFALGVVLFQLLTGSLPVELPAGGSLWGVLGALQKAHERGLPRVKQLAPWVSEAADGLSARLLARVEVGRPRDGVMALRVLDAYEPMRLSLAQGAPKPSSRPQAPAVDTSLGVRGLGAEVPPSTGAWATRAQESSLVVRGLDGSAPVAGSPARVVADGSRAASVDVPPLKRPRQEPTPGGPSLAGLFMALVGLPALLIPFVIVMSKGVSREDAVSGAGPGTAQATQAPMPSAAKPLNDGDIGETLRYVRAEGTASGLDEDMMALVDANPDEALSVLLGRGGIDTDPAPVKQANTRKGSAALAPEDAKVGASAEMVSVPAGEFFYGCNQRVDSNCSRNERPGRRMTLPAFRIDRTEVTVAAYRACVQAGRCSAPDRGGYLNSCNWESGRDDHPVNCVDWNQARAYCGWRGKRLPTEQEWEKAARGTDGRMYAWGNEDVSSGSYANIEGTEDGWYRTSSVGVFPSGRSPYGVLDMTGNVWEWCENDAAGGKALRGGSWFVPPQDARASFRRTHEPRRRDGGLGFRCAQSAN
jgi:formylglycine-generating enzyme required for sulfatase activity/serine/threonine protein kinase